MDEKKSFVTVSVSGSDHPRITSAFSKILVGNPVEILDMEQSSPFVIVPYKQNKSERIFLSGDLQSPFS